jgi:hypothetical protein
MIYLITLQYSRPEAIKYQLIFIMGCIFYLSIYLVAKTLLSEDTFIQWKPYLFAIAVIDAVYLMYHYNGNQKVIANAQPVQLQYPATVQSPNQHYGIQ